jgi:drug/metabolite transporter (DMT)-like permease
MIRRTVRGQDARTTRVFDRGCFHISNKNTISTINYQLLTINYQRYEPTTGFSILMPNSSPPKRWHVAIALGVGVLAVSTSAIWIRLAIAAAGMRGVGFSLFLAVARLTLAALILLPIQWRSVSRSPASVPVSRSAMVCAVAAGLFLALHFATWITSLSYTSIAASTALVTTNPLWVALLSWVWYKEVPTRKTTIGMAIALAGGILVSVGGGDSSGSQPLLGNFLALIGSWTVSVYLLLGREAQCQGFSVGKYGLVAYSTAAVVLLPFPFLFGVGYTGYPAAVYLYSLLMALLPQVMGHTIINWAVRWVSPTLVTLTILFEPVAASILGFWVFGEVPTLQVWVGAVVLLVGVAIAALRAQ